MRVNRLVVTVTKEEADLDIAEVTLLSKKEYRAAKDVIPKRDDWWWLRSPYSHDVSFAVFVRDTGRLDDCIVDDESVGVSPALRIRNLRSSNLSRGDKFELAGHTWTVISDDMALCDEFVGFTCFRKDRDAEDANVYEASDVKKWLENWAAENGITVSAEPVTA